MQCGEEGGQTGQAFKHPNKSDRQVTVVILVFVVEKTRKVSYLAAVSSSYCRCHYAILLRLFTSLMPFRFFQRAIFGHVQQRGRGLPELLWSRE
jgi:hypothetical protein